MLFCLLNRLIDAIKFHKTIFLIIFMYSIKKKNRVKSINIFYTLRQKSVRFFHLYYKFGLFSFETLEILSSIFFSNFSPFNKNQAKLLPRVRILKKIYSFDYNE